MKLDFVSDINKENYYTLGYDLVDRFMVQLAWVSAVLISLYSFAIYFSRLASYYPNPFTWRVVELNEVLSVVVIAFLAAGILQSLHGKIANHYHWRLLVTNLLLVFPYLLVFISGGSIEWHFYFFVTFAFLALYADWRLGWWAILAVALHHGILNYVKPGWVYFYGRNDVAFLSHAIIVFFMAIATTVICERFRTIADTNRKLAEQLSSKKIK